MKYYLDVNAVVELYERDYKIENELTYISNLTISEMCKNLDNNFKRQKSQFEFIENSKIRKDWKHHDEIIFGEAFDNNYPRPNDQVEELYFAVLQSKNLASSNNHYSQSVLDKNNIKHDAYTNSPQMGELISAVFYTFNNFYYNLKWEEMIFNKECFSGKKDYEIRKMLLKSFLIANFRRRGIEKITGKKKREFRNTLKGYNGSIDLYLDCSVYYYQNIDKVERNDAPDLLHISYLGNDDVFVTQDKKLKKLCDNVSNGNRVISIEEYFKRVYIDK